MLIFFIASNVQAVERSTFYLLGIGALFVFLPSISSFYYSYYILFSSYIRTRKPLSLILYGVGGIIGIALLCSLFISIAYGKQFMFQNGIESYVSEVFIIICFGLVNGTVGFILKGFFSWYDELKMKENLIKSKHEIELELIKAKLDPHFLFNTINNIDGLMMKDVDKASKYLDKLSSILRYMLYKSKDELIPLSEELSHIQQYIDLQKIRTSQSDFVTFTVEGTHTDHLIPYMLFAPIIENAFKHVSTKKKKESIIISVISSANMIHFRCDNIWKKSMNNPNREGIGNELLYKRLDLIFPDKYNLDINTENERYSVNLKIDMSEN